MLVLSSKSSSPSSSSSTSALKYSPSFWFAQVVGAILLCPPGLIERSVPMIAPFPATIRELQHRILVDRILEECWTNPDAGYEVQPSDEWIINNQQQQMEGVYFDILEENNTDETTGMALKKPSTYGEITSLGARQLFGAMGLLDFPINQQQRQQQHPVHFFDLGSGTGKLVGQVALELPHDIIEKATGIELSPSRHDAAIQAKKALQRLLGKEERSESIKFGRERNNKIGVSPSQERINLSTSDNLELLQGDLFDTDLSTATHVYVASLCFPKNLMVRLEEKLQVLLEQQPENQQNQTHDNVGGSVLQWVASLEPFPNNLGGIRPIVRFMEMSWTKPFGSAVYLYSCNTRNSKKVKGKELPKL